MKHLIALCSAALLLLSLAACDDNTGTLGGSITPNTDIIVIDTATYYATSRSFRADSILAKAANVWFGRYTDPETNSVFEANFITQLNCVEGKEVFPKPDQIKGDVSSRTELRLYYTSYYGDSLNAMQLDVYALDKTLIEGRNYYTNIDIDQYLAPDAKPIATKTWSAKDYAIDDLTILDEEDHYHNVCIPLPTELGTQIIQAYRQHPEYFSGATSFIENVCPGFYVKCTQGDGTVLCLTQISLNVCFDMVDNDSTYITQFSGSQEVLQVNRFDVAGVDELISDEGATWLKTPAGVFTEVTLPVDEIIAGEQDTINSVKITFTRYNNQITTGSQAQAPSTLLLVRKGQMYRFFENNEVPDNQTSYYTSFNSIYNQYEFSNIARLIVACRSERDTWITDWLSSHPGATDAEALAAFHAACPDWNRVVLIPITTTTSTSGTSTTLVTVRHEFAATSARLQGGPATPIPVKIITSRF